jgi:hypothetical protein
MRLRAWARHLWAAWGTLLRALRRPTAVSPKLLFLASAPPKERPWQRAVRRAFQACRFPASAPQCQPAYQVVPCREVSRQEVSRQLVP